ncbi:hypothetical protein [Cellulomonas sp. PS-H5]|uniref:hypothetical protein n=1 Tax=Cellulomonas sp. PS-H5 TaxID=2820400 RepID=UPI001C4FBD12|nr:hypothetical protein [Cellulomonas sp. PS-H5]MBW0253745.1 hypothetical protein [Cellulomonas sp. PS-H5]
MQEGDLGTKADETEDDEYVVFAEAPPMAEEVQALGREGVAIVKRWLEATTHIRLNYDVYDFGPQCMVPYVGGVKRFDLAGSYTSGDRAPVVVECKRYKTVGGQAGEFREFLRIAYSSVLADITHYTRDRGTRFIWVTTHPFSQKQWAHLETHDYMRAALEEKPEYLGGSKIDETRLRDVASRVMVLVLNMKQEALSLTIDELNKVRTVLERS